MKPFETPIALRCWPVFDKAGQQVNETTNNPKRFNPNGRRTWIGERWLIIDTETATDEYQSLRFGVFQRMVKGRHYIEGIFIADDLEATDPEGLAAIRAYAQKHNLILFTRSEFIKRMFYIEAYRLGALVIGFNLPFDLTRIATSVTASEGEHRDRFRLYFRHHLENPQARPDIGITPLSEHAARIEFLPPAPKGTPTRWLNFFSGRFLDLHQAIYAITGENHNLRRAGEAFGAKIKKGETEEHGGPITEEYLDYARQDVAATFSLYLAVRDAGLRP